MKGKHHAWKIIAFGGALLVLGVAVEATLGSKSKSLWPIYIFAVIVIIFGVITYCMEIEED